MKKDFPLTKIGTGIALSDFEDNQVLSPKFINQLVEEYEFIVLKNFLPNINEAHQFAASMGELVENKKREDSNKLVLDGSKAGIEVLQGKGRLPLHCDGLMMNEKVRLVFIYCIDCNLETGGRTYLSSNTSVWPEIPSEIKDVIINNGIEVYPCDAYYLKNEPVYHKFSGIQEVDGKQYLNGGLHYHPEEKPSWKVRFAGIDEDLSYEYFNKLEALFEDKKRTYFHDWAPGDLLIIDNVKSMHGREAYTGMRNLIQFQVRA